MKKFFFFCWAVVLFAQIIVAQNIIPLSANYSGKKIFAQNSHVKSNPVLQILDKQLSVDYSNNWVNISVKVRAYSEDSLQSVKLFFDDFPYGILYDDGAHNDGEAGDSIYGGEFLVVFPEQSVHSLKVCATDISENVTSKTLSTIDTREILTDEFALITNGNVQFKFDNKGVLADFEPEGCGIFYRNTFDAENVMYSGGYVLTGYSNGELWANGIATTSRIVDYSSGGVNENSPSKIYYVKSSDPPFSESWQNWAEAVNGGAKFYDGNGDGVYNPVDLNSNGIWDANEDAPEINGTITAWCVYNDGIPADERLFSDMHPLGIEVRQTIWTDEENPELKNVFFVRYSIYNTGTVTETLDSVYFGVWTDNDIGEFSNDFVGSTPELFTGYTYDVGYDELFYLNSPTTMKTLLNVKKNPVNDIPNLSLLNTSYISYISAHPTQGDPRNVEELRNYMLGKNKLGEEIEPCNFEYGIVLGEDCSTIDGSWMFSGNPVDSIGWINTYGGEKLSMLNVGAFTIGTGESVDITVAYHFSRGESSLNSVSLGLDKAQYLRDNADLLDVDNEHESDEPHNFALYQNYPNPFNPTTNITYVIARSEATRQSAAIPVQLIVYDALGREVATLVNAKQAPGEYSVQFDASSASGGLSSGVYIYTLRVGGFVQTRKMILMK